MRSHNAHIVSINGVIVCLLALFGMGVPQLKADDSIPVSISTPVSVYGVELNLGVKFKFNPTDGTITDADIKLGTKGFDLAKSFRLFRISSGSTVAYQIGLGWSFSPSITIDGWNVGVKLYGLDIYVDYWPTRDRFTVDGYVRVKLSLMDYDVLNADVLDSYEGIYPGMPPPTRKWGDANNDGSVNSADATLICVNPTSISYKGQADVNLDGVVNLDDANQINSGAPLPCHKACTSFAMSYDSDYNGHIDKSEAVKAVLDYFEGRITKDRAIEVVLCFFGHT